MDVDGDVDIDGDGHVERRRCSFTRIPINRPSTMSDHVHVAVAVNDHVHVHVDVVRRF